MCVALQGECPVRASLTWIPRSAEVGGMGVINRKSAIPKKQYADVCCVRANMS